MKIIWKPIFFVFFLRVCYSLLQGVKVGTLSRQNERKSSYVRLAHTSIFGLCFMSVCLLKSNCYSLIYSSLIMLLGFIWMVKNAPMSNSGIRSRLMTQDVATSCPGSPTTRGHHRSKSASMWVELKFNIAGKIFGIILYIPTDIYLYDALRLSFCWEPINLFPGYQADNI